MCARVCACACACVRVCVRACARARVRARVRQGLPFDVPFCEKPMVAYGSMPVGNFYPDEEGAEESLEAADGEDEQAKAKRMAKVRRKQFMDLTRALIQEGKLTKKMRNTLEKFWDKKDEAVTKAFDQYMTAPDPDLFVSRVLDYFQVPPPPPRRGPLPTRSLAARLHSGCPLARLLAGRAVIPSCLFCSWPARLPAAGRRAG